GGRLVAMVVPLPAAVRIKNVSRRIMGPRLDPGIPQGLAQDVLAALGEDALTVEHLAQRLLSGLAIHDPAQTGPAAHGAVTGAALQGAATGAALQGAATGDALQGAATGAAAQGAITGAALQGADTGAAAQGAAGAAAHGATTGAALQGA